MSCVTVLAQAIAVDACLIDHAARQKIMPPRNKNKDNCKNLRKAAADAEKEQNKRLKKQHEEKCKNLRKVASNAEKELNKGLKKLYGQAGVEARVEYLGQPDATRPGMHITHPEAWIVGDGEWHSQTLVRLRTSRWVCAT